MALPEGRGRRPVLAVWEGQVPPTSSSSTGNRLLDRLPKKELNRLMAVSETVSLPHGRELYRQDGPLPHVYFPRSGVCSVVVLMNDGKVVEAATVGNEGMVGLPAYLGLDFAPDSTISQVPGAGFRVAVATLREVGQQGSILDTVLRRYDAYRHRYGNQTIACNALHTVDERACRWLLMTHDRAGQDDFLLTHEFLAEMLGVHRQTVSIVAGTLQRAGFITYRRGQVRV